MTHHNKLEYSWYCRTQDGCYLSLWVRLYTRYDWSEKAKLQMLIKGACFPYHACIMLTFTCKHCVQGRLHIPILWRNWSMASFGGTCLKFD